MNSSNDSLAMQRITRLVDENSFMETGSLVTARNTDFNLADMNTPSDGVITGHGLIEGSLVFVYSQDASVLGGTIGEMHAKKIAAVYDMAMKMGAPVIGFIDCAGIESPGLTSCPAIGERIAGMLRERLELQEKERFIATRKGVLKPETLSKEERTALIRENPAYGNIICRCEMVTEGEIIDAIRRPLGAKSLDGVKRRTRAGMGRCQSGFCSPRTMEILAREWKMDIREVTKSGGNSYLAVGTNKDVF